MKPGKMCIYPGCTKLAVHSSYCREHGNLLSRERHKKRYALLQGEICRCVCDICNTPFMTTSHDNKYCPKCRNEIKLRDVNHTKYIALKCNGKRTDKHREIAKQVHAITQHNDVVHHMDGNKANNDPANLVVLSHQNHARLHMWLKAERIRRPNVSLVQLSWEFIWQNAIPYLFCNSVPGYHYALDD